MKKAFSIVELIFIIVIVGILASIGGNLLPDNKQLNEVNFISMKIKEKQRFALGNIQRNFGDQFWSIYNKNRCITFDKVSLENEDEASDSQKKMKIASTIYTDTNTTICFDEYGRPYNSGALIRASKDINVTYKGKITTISVMPMSGYVIIK